MKLQEYYHQSWGTTLTATEDQKLALKQWHYCAQLAKYLYEVSNFFERQNYMYKLLHYLFKF